MAKTKIIKDAERLNLYLARAVKQWLFATATAREQSISAVVTGLVRAEEARQHLAQPPHVAAPSPVAPVAPEIYTALDRPISGLLDHQKVAEDAKRVLAAATGKKAAA